MRVLSPDACGATQKIHCKTTKNTQRNVSQVSEYIYYKRLVKIEGFLRFFTKEKREKFKNMFVRVNVL